MERWLLLLALLALVAASFGADQSGTSWRFCRSFESDQVVTAPARAPSAKLQESIDLPSFMLAIVLGNGE
jgi:hypothetical protein